MSLQTECEGTVLQLLIFFFKGGRGRGEGQELELASGLWTSVLPFQSVEIDTADFSGAMKICIIQVLKSYSFFFFF